MATIERESRTYNVTHSTPQHNIIIQRTSVLQSGSTQSRNSSINSRADDDNFVEGEQALQVAKGVGEVKLSRDHEKKELQDLNDRFSNYLDKVRNLEAQNRKLADELEKLKSKWGKETAQIKAMYQAELDDARRSLDEAENEKARLEIKVAYLEETLEELRIKLTMKQQEIAFYRDILTNNDNLLKDHESETKSLRLRLESFETESQKDKETIDKLESLLKKTREDLDNETLGHIDAENKRQTLQEAIAFANSIHDQESKELAALAYQNTTPDRDYWKSELADAIREIELMYGMKLEDMKTDMEANYNLKLKELRIGETKGNAEANKSKEECKDLRNAVTDIRDKINDMDARNNQLAREIEALKREKEDRERDLMAENDMLREDLHNLRDELEGVMKELQVLLGTKMSLDLEIAAYRKLLDFEENRSSRTQNYDDSRSRKPEPIKDDGDSESFSKGEMSAKTTYSRTAKGAMAVTDCPPDGRFVRLENTGRKEENIANFKIQRKVDNREQPSFVLDERFKSIQPGQKITIWAKGVKPPNAPASDIEMPEYNWGIGSTVITSLVNVEGEERASLTQKTTYS